MRVTYAVSVSSVTAHCAVCTRPRHLECCCTPLLPPSLKSSLSALCICMALQVQIPDQIVGSRPHTEPTEKFPGFGYPLVKMRLIKFAQILLFPERTERFPGLGCSCGFRPNISSQRTKFKLRPCLCPYAKCTNLQGRKRRRVGNEDRKIREEILKYLIL